MSRAMLDDNDTLRDLIADILNPTTENIDHDKLEEFLLGFVDKLEMTNHPLDAGVKKIIGTCLKLWNEKEAWKDMYYKLYDRYNKHLDDEISRYNKMLGRMHT